jgi:NADPH:quinone reductase
MQTTMRAVVADDYGPPESLAVRDVPVPRPGPGQVQVRVRASALNPGELRMLAGGLGGAAALSFPHVAGGDFAGTVTAAGAGVTRFAVGDELFGLGLPRTVAGLAAQVSSPPSLTTGTFAEYAVFDADTPGLAIRPAGLPAEHAAALPTVGLTALPLLRAGRFERGELVLVTGATGGVGSMVVPMLAAAGAHVIATASGADDDYVRGLGASEVIDYRAADTAAEVLRRHPAGVDAVVNLALRGDSVAALTRAIRPGGRLLTIVFPAPDPAALDGAGLALEVVFTSARPGDLDALAADALDGSLPVTVSGRYRLADGVRACTDLLREHTRGKLVIAADGDGYLG